MEAHLKGHSTYFTCQTEGKVSKSSCGAPLSLWEQFCCVCCGSGGSFVESGKNRTSNCQEMFARKLMRKFSDSLHYTHDELCSKNVDVYQPGKCHGFIFNVSFLCYGILKLICLPPCLSISGTQSELSSWCSNPGRIQSRQTISKVQTQRGERHRKARGVTQIKGGRTGAVGGTTMRRRSHALGRSRRSQRRETGQDTGNRGKTNVTRQEM